MDLILDFTMKIMYHCHKINPNDLFIQIIEYHPMFDNYFVSKNTFKFGNNFY